VFAFVHSEGSRVKNNEILTEIRDANLNYLMLARQMIRADRASAIFRLGLPGGLVDVLDSLSSAQVIRLASSNMMLARLRFEDEAIIEILASQGRDISLATTHAALLMAVQPFEGK
jgi:flagellar transcriptional activator FlhD